MDDLPEYNPKIMAEIGRDQFEQALDFLKGRFPGTTFDRVKPEYVLKHRHRPQTQLMRETVVHGTGEFIVGFTHAMEFFSLTFLPGDAKTTPADFTPWRDSTTQFTIPPRVREIAMWIAVILGMNNVEVLAAINDLDIGSFGATYDIYEKLHQRKLAKETKDIQKANKAIIIEKFDFGFDS